MKYSFEQFIERTKTIGLAPEEKALLGGAILRHMEAHPVDERVAFPARQEKYRAGWSGITSKTNKKYVMAIGMIIALLLSGSVSYAAEGALPGDALYVVKTEVNERVKSALALSAEAEAKLQAKLAAKRLEEAEKLAAEGKLDTETSAEIAERFERHEGRSRENIARLEAVGKLEEVARAHAELEAALKAHEAVLAKFLEADGAIEAGIAPLHKKVEIKVKEREHERAKIELKLKGILEGDTGIATGTESKLKIKIEDDGSVEIESETETPKSGDANESEDHSRRDEGGARDSDDDILKVDGKVEIEAKTKLNVPAGSIGANAGGNAGTSVGL